MGFDTGVSVTPGGAGAHRRPGEVLPLLEGAVRGGRVRQPGHPAGGRAGPRAAPHQLHGHPHRRAARPRARDASRRSAGKMEHHPRDAPTSYDAGEDRAPGHLRASSNKASAALGGGLGRPARRPRLLAGADLAHVLRARWPASSSTRWRQLTWRAANLQPDGPARLGARPQAAVGEARPRSPGCSSRRAPTSS